MEDDHRADLIRLLLVLVSAERGGNGKSALAREMSCDELSFSLSGMHSVRMLLFTDCPRASRESSCFVHKSMLLAL